jgi:DNA repair protein RadA/Sms
VYLNVAGGIRLSDTAGDLGVVCALVSSLLDKPLSTDSVFLGEVGLGAEIRAVNKLDQRLAEIEKMGFRQAFVPAANTIKKNNSLVVHQVQNFISATKKAL